MKTTLHRTIAAIACVALPMAVASCGAVEDIRNGVDVAEITEGTKELADAAASQTGSADSDSTHHSKLEIGDCVLGGAGIMVDDVDLVDCAEPHNAKLFHVFDVDLPEYDMNLVAEKAERGCSAEFAAFVGVPADSSSLGLTWFEPTVGSWIDGDREVMCFVEDSAGGLTGTMRGANR